MNQIRNEVFLPSAMAIGAYIATETITKRVTACQGAGFAGLITLTYRLSNRILNSVFAPQDKTYINLASYAISPILSYAIFFCFNPLSLPAAASLLSVSAVAFLICCVAVETLIGISISLSTPETISDTIAHYENRYACNFDFIREQIGIRAKQESMLWISQNSEIELIKEILKIALLTCCAFSSVYLMKSPIVINLATYAVFRGVNALVDSVGRSIFSRKGKINNTLKDFFSFRSVTWSLIASPLISRKIMSLISKPVPFALSKLMTEGATLFGINLVIVALYVAYLLSQRGPDIQKKMLRSVAQNTNSQNFGNPIAPVVQNNQNLGVPVPQTNLPALGLQLSVSDSITIPPKNPADALSSNSSLPKQSTKALEIPDLNLSSEFKSTRRPFAFEDSLNR